MLNHVKGFKKFTYESGVRYLLGNHMRLDLIRVVVVLCVFS